MARDCPVTKRPCLGDLCVERACWREMEAERLEYVGDQYAGWPPIRFRPYDYSPHWGDA